MFVRTVTEGNDYLTLPEKSPRKVAPQQATAGCVLPRKRSTRKAGKGHQTRVKGIIPLRIVKAEPLRRYGQQQMERLALLVKMVLRKKLQ